ncbi:MAG: cache domain-containing protein [Planctomycetota bacterium]|jgi:signal transduction histidine kinase
MNSPIKIVGAVILIFALGNLIIALGLADLLEDEEAVQLKNLRQQMENEISGELKARVESAYSVANHHMKEYADQDAAREHAMEDINSMRYDKTNYIWVHRLNPAKANSAFMVVHAADRLRNKDLSGLIDFENVESIYHKGIVYRKDAPEISHIKPTDIFKEFNRVCLQNGDGIVPYYWPKVIKGKADKVGYRKVSYVKYLKEWKWVIGTGVYADAIDSAVNKKAAEIKGIHKKLMINVMTYIVLITIGLMLVVAFLAYKVSLKQIKLLETEISERKAASYALSNSQEELTKLNEELEQRVDRRTKALKEAADDLQELNERLKQNQNHRN